MWKNKLKDVDSLKKEGLVFLFFKTLLRFSRAVHLLLFGGTKKTLILQGTFQYPHINTPNSSNNSYI